ncbi:MAG: hypothetical protein F6K23_22760 [Okeania sp. SIO2C9]|uniref:hypothetical protein n=1 Tax=Okeania sp. SIO2C9 TaxID=2607791 RepID=UPI0013C25B03|nr:hypothetical protein [Okeania sp. SIO2C9]NEQ75619.1 hypothetical protein [Okeania sp. SIO2C9]
MIIYSCIYIVNTNFTTSKTDESQAGKDLKCYLSKLYQNHPNLHISFNYKPSVVVILDLMKQTTHSSREQNQ